MNQKPSARFWANVNHLLETRGMSARALSRDVGITSAAMSKYARGTSPSLDVAVRMAEALGVSMEDLLHSDAKRSEDALSRREHPSSRPPRRVERLEAEKLIESLGLGRLALLASRGAWKQEQDLLWILQKRYPASVPFETIRDTMKDEHPDLSVKDIAACLAALVERGQVKEETGEHYRVTAPRSELATRPAADQFALELIQVLLRDILPASRTDPDQGAMLLWRAHTKREKAAGFTGEFRAGVRELLSRYTDPDGDQEFVVVAAAAVPTSGVPVAAQ